jgi:hypothetical protein
MKETEIVMFIYYDLNFLSMSHSITIHRVGYLTTSCIF